MRLRFLNSLFFSITCMTCQANSNPFEPLWSTAKGHLGVAAIDTANQGMVNYHAAERFPMDSTFKLMLVAAVLKKSMSEPQLMQANLSYTAADLAANGWSPVTKNHVATGMTVSALCAAAITESDNTAANVLLKKMGGPKAITAFARSIGDTEFSLNRWEPQLNLNTPGDLRDTTTPAAMAKSLAKLTLGDTLGTSQRTQLQTWLKANKTGTGRIRAGVPSSWTVGDKTGTGAYATSNDIAIIWPASCPPVILAVYYTQGEQNTAARDHVIASATQIALTELAKNNLCLSQALNSMN
jgi:beta-lactamase class A